MMEWLFEMRRRIPPITKEQIAEMRHIQPLLRVGNGCDFQRVKDQDKLHAENVSFLWNAEPVGNEICFSQLDTTTIITQHESSVFFKPSLAEVYAWIRLHFADNWKHVGFFCVENPRRISGSSDCVCDTVVMGNKPLVKGRGQRMDSGAISYELVPETV
jgi:hypothetical protein